MVVGKASVLACCLVAAACGRIAFDPLAGGVGDAASDTITDDGPPMLTCPGLSASCGPAGTSPCCGSQLVPGGMFYRSYDKGTDGMYPSLANPATVSDFRLDTYVVTVGRFRQFVDAGMGTVANPPPTDAGARTLNGVADQGGWDATWNANLAADTAALVAALNCDSTWQSWTNAPGANEGLPLNCMTWYEAFAFCVWDGGFLPTEAEWNYAAVGGSEQRAYPWSNPASDVGSIDCSYADYYYNNATYCVNPPTGGVNRVGSESPKGDGKWGHADLGGNVWEWTLDWYAPYANPCNDCAQLTSSAGRVARSGVFFQDSWSIRGAYRNYFSPDLVPGLDFVGVRCARTP